MKKMMKKTSPPKRLSKVAPQTKPGKVLKKVTADREAKPVVSKSLKKAAAPAPKALKKAEPKKQAPKSGPIPVIPKGFKWKGKKDPKFPGVVLVKDSDIPDTYPHLHRLAPPETFWRINKADGSMRDFVTVMPDGVYCSWNGCSRCQNHATRCICTNGIMFPRSIEYIYIRALMRADGIKAMDEGKVDSTSPAVRERALYWYQGKETGYVQTGEAPRRPVAGRGGTPAPAKPAKPADRPSAPQKKALRKPLRKAEAPVERRDVKNLDIAALNKDAASAADALTEQVTKALSKPAPKSGGKTLKKRGK